MSDDNKYVTNTVADRICDKCYRFVADDLNVVGFNVSYADGSKKLFKGHSECMTELIGELNELIKQEKLKMREEEDDNE